MILLLHVFMKAALILIVFLLAVLGFGLLLNITFSIIIKETPNDKSQTSRLLRRGIGRTREIGLADARENPAAAKEKDQGEHRP